MLRSLRTFVRRVMERTGLIGPYYRMVERRVARATFDAFDDGRPMPAPDLMMAVSGSAGQGWFSQRGQADAAKFMGLARKHGLTGPLEVLDWGCGSGRIARWTAPDIVAAGGGFSGSDLNPKLVGLVRGEPAGPLFPQRPAPAAGPARPRHGPGLRPLRPDPPDRGHRLGLAGRGPPRAAARRPGAADLHGRPLRRALGPARRPAQAAGRGFYGVQQRPGRLQTTCPPG